MQFLDVISVNIWAILASLANLLLLTWILKRFLFKPVKKLKKKQFGLSLKLLLTLG